MDSDLGKYAKVWSRRQWKKDVAAVQTMYKRKGRKINSVNVPLPRGVNPGAKANSGGQLRGGETWRRFGDAEIIRRQVGDGSERHEEIGEDLETWRRGGTVVPRGSRLTPERLERMQIGGDFLSVAEKELFVGVLFDYEGAIAFDNSEMGKLKPEIEPPFVMHTVPWQQQNLRLPKAMQEIATEIVKEKLARGMLEHSQRPESLFSCSKE